MGTGIFCPYRAVHQVHRFLNDGHTQAAAIGGVAPGLISAVKNFKQTGKGFRWDTRAVIGAGQCGPPIALYQGDGQLALGFLLIFQAVGGDIHEDAGNEEPVPFQLNFVFTQRGFYFQPLLGKRLIIFTDKGADCILQ